MTIQPAGTTLDYTVTWLEMTARPDYDWPSAPTQPTVSLLRAEEPPVWYFLSLYDAVGRDYAWEDMHERSEADVATWLHADGMSLWTLIGKGWPQGFFLLNEREATQTEIVYFGMVSDAVGAGLGRYLLRTAILTAWQRDGLETLTVNTCTLDHPRALAFYQKHGFTPVRRETFTRTLTRDRDLSRIPD